MIKSPHIRPIQPQDNFALGTLVQAVLMELGAPKIGTAYSDPFLFDLFNVYSQPKSIYFVVEIDGIISGGAGIGPLDGDVCELQKMYFLPEARGLGIGSKLMKLCLDAAQSFGYKQCYLETMVYMNDAQTLYKKVGFQYIDSPMGNTGHTSCPVWMIKNLDLTA